MLIGHSRLEASQCRELPRTYRNKNGNVPAYWGKIEQEHDPALLAAPTHAAPMR